MKKDVHVVRDAEKGKWVVKVSDSIIPHGSFNTQREAIQHGREVGRRHQTELIIHGRDGKIRDKYSYGNDPRDIEG